MSRRIDYYPVDGHTPFFRIEQDGPLGELHEAGPGTRLLVDGRDVLTLERRKEWFGPRRSLGLVPSNGGKFMRFMVGEDTVVQDLTDGALVHLVLESEDGVVVELPLDRLAENVETLKLNSYNAERPYLAIE